MSKRIRLILYLIIICLSAVIAVTYFENFETKRDPPVDIRVLAASLNDFPEKWIISIQPKLMSPQNRENMGEEGIYEAFEIPGPSKYSPKGSAEHWVLRIRNPYLARMAFFQAPKEFYFSENLRKNEIERYDYQSSVADSWQYGCKNNFQRGDGEGIICAALGRYDEFLSIFLINVKQDELTPEILRKILRAIDERMAKNLKKQ